MKSASYSVIRYIADPARNEPVNIGVLIWNETGFALTIDDTAVLRVVKDNPHLERDALLYVESYLRQRVTRTVPPFTEEGFLRVLAEQSGFPVVLTEPRRAAVSGDEAQQLEEALDRLVARVVRPSRRKGGAPGLRATAALQRDLKPLIDERRIERRFTLEAPQTRVPRSIDFYANSDANVALDILNLMLAKAEDIRDRADLEAFKVWDLVQSPMIQSYYVLPIFSDSVAFGDANDAARKILTSTGAQLASDVDEAREILVSAAHPGRRLFDGQ